MSNLFQRILILAPTGRDATLSRTILSDAGLNCESVSSIDVLCREIELGAGAVVITEESVEEDKSKRLSSVLQSQPTWSDIPILVMTRGGADSAVAVHALEKLGDVILLERPVRVNTLISACRAALRTRARQLALRDRGDQLLEQADRLQRSNLELEQFAYVSSHDLQEPLRKISIYTDMVVNKYGDQLDKDGKRYLGIVADGARRMSTLIRDLLSYAKLTKVDTLAELTDLNQVLSRAISDLEVLIGEKKAVITHDRLPVVMAEKDRLQHVFLNLLSNALKFQGAIPPRIHVSSTEKNGFVHVSVKDNGIGIEPAYLTRIFQVFQRLHNKGEYSGTGIGLAICKKIIERNGGKIWANSKLGKGSTFYFTLPMARTSHASLPSNGLARGVVAS